MIYAQKDRSSKIAAFSLVEVVLSLAIISVALLSMIGMLGHGINGASEAAGRTIGSQISRRLMGEVQLMEWRSLSQAFPLRYFDEFGEELTGSDPEINSAFTALTEVINDPVSISTSSSDANHHARKVIVFVADRSGPGGKQLIDSFREDGEISDKLQIYSSTVVNLEK